MKYFLILVFTAFLFNSCDKEEEKLEAFNPEAFAFDIGDKWEVNGLVNVKGFIQKESEETFTASIRYSVDLVSPDGTIMKNAFNDSKEDKKEEVIADIPLEVQFELDKSYKAGKYKLLFNIMDNYSDNFTEASVEFELSE